MEERVPDIVLIIIGIVSSRITSRFPSLRVEYKDLVVLGVAVGIVSLFQLAGIMDVDVAAQYYGVDSNWATTVISGLAAWVAAMVWHKGEKWIDNRSMSPDRGGLDQDTKTTIDDAFTR